jgi:hypothetical protein
MSFNIVFFLATRQDKKQKNVIRIIKITKFDYPQPRKEENFHGCEKIFHDMNLTQMLHLKLAPKFLFLDFPAFLALSTVTT